MQDFVMTLSASLSKSFSSFNKANHANYQSKLARKDTFRPNSRSASADYTASASQTNFLGDQRFKKGEGRLLVKSEILHQSACPILGIKKQCAGREAAHMSRVGLAR